VSLKGVEPGRTRLADQVRCESVILTTKLLNSIEYTWVNVMVDVGKLCRTGRPVGGRGDMFIGSEPIRSNVCKAAANQ
jgi:hypothetical protein